MAQRVKIDNNPSGFQRSSSTATSGTYGSRSSVSHQSARRQTAQTQGKHQSSTRYRFELAPQGLSIPPPRTTSVLSAQQSRSFSPFPKTEPLRSVEQHIRLPDTPENTKKHRWSSSTKGTSSSSSSLSSSESSGNRDLSEKQRRTNFSKNICIYVNGEAQPVLDSSVSTDQSSEEFETCLTSPPPRKTTRQSDRPDKHTTRVLIKDGVYWDVDYTGSPIEEQENPAVWYPDPRSQRPNEEALECIGSRTPSPTKGTSAGNSSRTISPIERSMSASTSHFDFSFEFGAILASDLQQVDMLIDQASVPHGSTLDGCDLNFAGPPKRGAPAFIENTTHDTHGKTTDLPKIKQKPAREEPRARYPQDFPAKWPDRSAPESHAGHCSLVPKIKKNPLLNSRLDDSFADHPDPLFVAEDNSNKCWLTLASVKPKPKVKSSPSEPMFVAHDPQANYHAMPRSGLGYVIDTEQPRPSCLSLKLFSKSRQHKSCDNATVSVSELSSSSPSLDIKSRRRYAQL